MGLITNLHSFLLPLTSLGRIDCVLKLPPPRFSPQAVSIIIQLNRELWSRPFEAISQDEITQPFQLVICAGSSTFQRNLYRESLLFRGTHGPRRQIAVNPCKLRAQNCRVPHPTTLMLCFRISRQGNRFVEKPVFIYLPNRHYKMSLLHQWSSRKGLLEERKCRGAETMHGTALVFNHRYQSRQASS